MAESGVPHQRAQQCKDEYTRLSGRVEKRLATLVTQARAADDHDLVETAHQVVDDLVMIQRITERLAREPVLSAHSETDAMRADTGSSLADALRVLDHLPGVDAPTPEEVRTAAAEAGPVLWIDQAERLMDFTKRERAIAARTRPQVQEMTEIVDFITTTPDAAHHPDILQKMYDAESITMSLFEELAMLDQVIDDLDSADDLVGIIETVNVRRTIVNMRESTAAFLNTFPNVECPPRWGPPPGARADD